MAPVRELAAQRKPAAPAAKEATESEQPSLSQLIESQQFVFSRRNRRDPFSPIGGGDTPSETAGEGKQLTEQDVDDIKKALVALTLAYKNRNPGQFQNLYDQVMKRLGAPCEAEDVHIHALELKRRARNLNQGMGHYERSIGWERELQWAEGQLSEMQKDATAGNLESLKARDREVKARIGAKIKDVDDPHYRSRMRDILMSSNRLLAKFREGMVEKDLENAEKQLAKMRDLLARRDYATVRTEYDGLLVSVEDLQIEDAALTKKRERILRTAADIKRQAEIGEIKQMLAKAKEYLGQMEKTFETQDYNAIADMNAKLQEDLRVIPSLEPELDDERAIYRRKGMDLDRRAKICIEFLGAPPTISGIGWHPQHPAAIVNEKTVGLGDYVDANTRVKSITPDTVVFNYKGENIERPMTGP